MTAGSSASRGALKAGNIKKSNQETNPQEKSHVKNQILKTETNNRRKRNDATDVQQQKKPKSSAKKAPTDNSASVQPSTPVPLPFNSPHVVTTLVSSSPQHKRNLHQARTSMVIFPSLRLTHKTAYRYSSQENANRNKFVSIICVKEHRWKTWTGILLLVSSRTVLSYNHKGIWRHQFTNIGPYKT